MPWRCSSRTSSLKLVAGATLTTGVVITSLTVRCMVDPPRPWAAPFDQAFTFVRPDDGRR